MGDLIEYNDVVQEIRGALNPGKLKLQSENVVFKNLKTGKVDQYTSGDIEAVSWLKRARGNCLKIMLQNGMIHRYDGIKESEYDRLSTFVSKNYNTSLEKVDCSVKGWNWGIARFNGNALNFEVDKNMAFEIPLTNVSHTTTNKNEVTLEFHQNDDASVSLMELRFHIPSELEKDVVQDFYKNVMSKADIIQATGDAIVTFDQVQCLTPRGRYDIKIYPTFLQLHGKTFDYKIPYATVLRLFLLPHNDRRQMFFVVSLDPPIKQGQTRYHFLILLFNKDDEMTTELAMSDEEIQKKYDGRLTREMAGQEYEVISKIFKAVVNRKITVPGGFLSQKGDQAIGCSYKAATGLLYPLERGLIFVHKPPIHIRFDEVSSVNFARSAGSTRSFDFDVETKSGNVYTYVGIEKDEYGKLYDFIRGKKLRVKNFGSKVEKGSYGDDMVDSDEEENAGEHDAYLERMKQEGRERDEDDDDDSEDESDESFNPGESGSEVAEEYDSNPETTSDSGSGEEGDEKKVKKEKKPKSEKPKSDKPRRKRKSKKNVDPDRPKRPLSAYFIWLNEIREQIKTEHPGISIIELTKKAADMWKDVGDKTKWEKLNEEAKERYAVAMEEYKKKVAERGDVEPPTVPAKKSSKAPKKSPRKSDTGGNKTVDGSFKSKEFISSSESSSDDNKPKKKKAKKGAKTEKASSKKEKEKEKEKEEEKEDEKEEEKEDEKEDEKEEEKDKEEEEEDDDPGELPSEEEILSTPEASESGSGDDDEEEEEEEEE